MAGTDVLMGQLRRNRLFSSEPESELDAILRSAGVRQLESNQTLFWQGDAVGHLFVVLDGALKLVRRDRKHRLRVTRVVGPSDLVALHCLFAGNGYAATSVALEDSEVLTINAERFLWHVKRKPELAWRIALHLSREVEALLEETQQLTMSSASERLAGYLLGLEEGPGQHDGERVPRRRADLASLLSMSTETLCREISKFRSRGWITTQDDGFTVLESEPLRSLVESGRQSSDEPGSRLQGGAGSPSTAGC